MRCISFRSYAPSVLAKPNLRHAQVIQVIGLVYEVLFTDYLPVVIYKDVTHNGIHPTFKVGVGFIFILIVQGFKGLLQQIISLLPGRPLICMQSKAVLLARQVNLF